MDNNIKRRLKKEDILTIPNVLSVIRILLIPIIVILYCSYNKYIEAVAVIALSGLTDVVDGFIARRFNMISDFGKFLDPVADKLTQAAMIFCLITRYKAMAILIGIMAIKEAVLIVCGLIALKKTDTVNGAKWFGKASTFTIYAVMIILFLMPDIPSAIATILIALCGVALGGSALLYAHFYYKALKGVIKKEGVED